MYVESTVVPIFNQTGNKQPEIKCKVHLDEFNATVK